MQKPSRATDASRLRSKFHQQNVSVRPAAMPPVASASLARVTKRLLSLRDADRMHRNPQLANDARTLIQTIKPFGVDEDPHFVHSQRILRTIGHFRLETHQMTEMLIHLQLQHTYLMDAQSTASLVTILRSLRLAYGKEALAKLSGRVTQLVEEFTPREVVVILNGFKDTSSIVRPAAATLLRHAPDMDAMLLLEAIHVLASTEHRAYAHQLLEQNAPLITEILEDQPSEDVVMQLVRTLKVCRLAPRRLMLNLSQKLLEGCSGTGAWLSTESIGEVFAMLEAVSFRHERLMLRLASKQLLQEGHIEVEPVLYTLQSLSHFLIRDANIFNGLLSMILPGLHPAHVPVLLRSFKRVNVSNPQLFHRPLEVLVGERRSIVTGDIVEAVVAAVSLREHEPVLVQKKLSLLLDELLQRHVVGDISELLTSLLTIVETCGGKELGDKAAVAHRVLTDQVVTAS